MKTLERVILKYVLRIVYLMSHIFKVKKRIVFATYRTDSIDGNYKYILDELKCRNLDYEYKMLVKAPGRGIAGKIKYSFHMMLSEYYLATSEFFIIDDFYFPVYVMNNLRKGTEVVQVWHACGAFKKFGFSILDKSFGADNNYVKYVPIHSNYSHVLVTSKEVAKHYAEAFNMSEKNINPLGVPRTDIFFNDNIKNKVKNSLYEKYPKLKGKKLILYAPTFRGNSQSDANTEITFHLDKVLNSLGDDYILGLKMHPFVKVRFNDKNKRLVDLSDYKSINDILTITEILITDYSSTVFEFSLLEKPMIFYADDLDEYVNQRDFYYEYKNFVPGPIAKNTDELIKCIENKEFNYKKIKDFKNKYFDYTDGGASKRFVDKIILKKG